MANLCLNDEYTQESPFWETFRHFDSRFNVLNRSAYEQSIFCEVFHSAESGWRECASCGKRLHCGCAVSKFTVELLDGGGVKCNGCAKSFGIHMIATDDKHNGIGTSKLGDQFNGITVDRLKLVQLSNPAEGIGFRHLLQPQNDATHGMFHKMKHEDGSQYLLSLNQGSNGTSDIPNLTMTLGSSLGHSANPFPGGSVVDEREYGKPASLFLHHGSRSRNVLPKPLPRSSFAPPGVETSSSSMGSQVRVARPPAEGRGRSQLLPRYWPRITDQELQQISGDSNATIVPLFEKMLSASDAGRIGRLVLPKACAEAYFPPISQPEGLPLKIQDVKGKEWVFQFRFWPNNNSRMYVLEGVTPCIQSMQLQAGDTVTFSRMDPEGKLIMGFRKASNSGAMQDTHQSSAHNGAPSSEAFFSGVFENLPIISGYSGLLQSLKGSTETHLNSSLSKHLTSSTSAAELSWHRLEKNEGKTKEGFVMSSSSSLMMPDRKRARNIGSKIKRLHMDSQDVLEIRLTWEDAQDLLRPPSTNPSTVVIEDIEFEEYEEPPVFGKRSVFIVRMTGEQEQWAQCDVCSKWRRLPNDVLLPNKWSCADNAWDPTRCSCSVPDEMTPQEQESLIRQNKEIKRQRTTTTTTADQRAAPENEPSVGLEALANAATLGESTSAAATTTKHPRHRPGCSCIVCIQPPSGKGKHKPCCTCNVCMTVKRRFKTLMLNKKKRQSEREAEIAARAHKPWPEPASPSPHQPSDTEARSANESESKSKSKPKKEGLDLNSDPVSMMSLLHVASRPLEAYLKQTGLASLAHPDQAQLAADESEAQQQQQQQQQEQQQEPNEENCPVSAQEQESGVGQEQTQNDPQIQS